MPLGHLVDLIWRFKAGLVFLGAGQPQGDLFCRHGIVHQPGTKYINQLFLVTREVRDTASGTVSVPADYSEPGVLLITVSAIGLLLPLAAIALVKVTPLRSM